MMDVLVLDQCYRPLGRMQWTRAITLYIEGQVEIVERYTDRVIRSAKETWPAPAVIRWLKFIKKPINGLRFSRQGVFIRDSGCCAYCARQVQLSKFTLDHVLPRSRGGTTCWENIVTSCMSCNRHKGDQTPEEAGMHLHSTPMMPKGGYTYFAVLCKSNHIPPEWQSWLI